MRCSGGFGFDSAVSIIGILILIAVLALIIVGIVLLIRGFSGRRDYSQMEELPEPSPGGPPSDSAPRLLRERYARGEIDREEYLQRLQDLVGG
ncbi:MAG: SHOCT domain-containing protein [Thermoleophilia bacterium]|nr:SHOCT domain-containing protein [Thermoleophilia bacterium]